MPERAQITIAGTRIPLHNSTLVRGDELRFNLRIVGTELADAAIDFTAKSITDDPDELAEISKSSALNGGITVKSNTGNLIDALIVIPSSETELIDIPAGTKFTLHFDVQIVRDGTPVNAPKVQTFFRQENSLFYLIGDITHTNT